MDSEGITHRERGALKLSTRLAIIVNTHIKAHCNDVFEKLTVCNIENLTPVPISITQITRSKDLAFGNSHMHNISGIFMGDGPSVHYDFDNDTSLLDSTRLSQILRQSTLNRDDTRSEIESNASSNKHTYNTYANQLKVKYGNKVGNLGTSMMDLDKIMRQGLQDSDSFYDENIYTVQEKTYDDSVANGSTQNVHAYRSIESNRTDFDEHSQKNSNKHEEMTSIMAEMQGSENVTESEGEACPYFGDTDYKPTRQMKRKRNSIFTNMKKISLVNQSCVNIPKGLRAFHDDHEADQQFISKSPQQHPTTLKVRKKTRRFTAGSMILPNRSFMRRAFTDPVNEDPVVVIQKPTKRSGSRHRRTSQRSSILRTSPENSFQISRKQMSPFPGFAAGKHSNSFMESNLSRVMGDNDSPGQSSKKMMFSGLDLLMGINSNQDSQFFPLQIFENEKKYNQFINSIQTVFQSARIRTLKPFFKEVEFSDRRPLRLIRKVAHIENRKRRDFFDALCQYIFKQSRSKKKFYRIARKFQRKSVKMALKSLMFAVPAHRMIVGLFKKVEFAVWKQNESFIKLFFIQAKLNLEAKKLNEKREIEEEKFRKLAHRNKNLLKLGGGLGNFMDDHQQNDPTPTPNPKNINELIRIDSEHLQSKTNNHTPDKIFDHDSNDASHSEYEISYHESQASRSGSNSPDTFRALIHHRGRIGSNTFSNSPSQSPRRMNRNIFAHDCTSESRHNSITGADGLYYEPSTENAAITLKQSNFNTFFQGDKGSLRDMSLAISHATFAKQVDEISDFEDVRLERLERKRNGSKSKPNLVTQKNEDTIGRFRSQKNVEINDTDQSPENRQNTKRLSDPQLQGLDHYSDHEIINIEDGGNSSDSNHVTDINIPEINDHPTLDHTIYKDNPKPTTNKKKKRKPKIPDENGIEGRSVSQISGKSDQASVPGEHQSQNTENRYTVKVEDLMIGQNKRDDLSSDSLSQEDPNANPNITSLQNNPQKAHRRGMDELLRKVRRNEPEIQITQPQAKIKQREQPPVTDSLDMITSGKLPGIRKLQLDTNEEIMTDKDAGSFGTIERLTIPKQTSSTKIIIKKSLKSIKQKKQESKRNISVKKIESKRYISVKKIESKRYISLNTDDAEDFIGRLERQMRESKEQPKIIEQFSEESSKEDTKRLSFKEKRGQFWGTEKAENSKKIRNPKLSGSDNEPHTLQKPKRDTKPKYAKIHSKKKKSKIKTKKKQTIEEEKITKREKPGNQRNPLNLNRFKTKHSQKSNIKKKAISFNVTGYSDIHRQQTPDLPSSNSNLKNPKSKPQIKIYKNRNFKNQPKNHTTQNSNIKNKRSKSTNALNRNTSRNKKSGTRIAAFVNQMIGQNESTNMDIRISFSKGNNRFNHFIKPRPMEPNATQTQYNNQNNPKLSLTRSKSAVSRKKKEKGSFSIKSPKNFFAEDKFRRPNDPPQDTKKQNQKNSKRKNSNSNSLLAVLRRGNSKFRSQKIGSEDEWSAHPPRLKQKLKNKNKNKKPDPQSKKLAKSSHFAETHQKQNPKRLIVNKRKSSHKDFIMNVDLREPEGLSRQHTPVSQNKTSILNSLLNVTANGQRDSKISKQELCHTKQNVFFKKNEAEKIDIVRSSLLNSGNYTRTSRKLYRQSETSRQTDNSLPSTHKNPKSAHPTPNLNSNSHFTDPESLISKSIHPHSILHSDISKINSDADLQFKSKMLIVIQKLNQNLNKKHISTNQKLRIVHKLISILDLFEKYFQTLFKSGNLSEEARRLLLIVEDIGKPFRLVLQTSKKEKLMKKIKAVRAKNLIQILEFMNGLLKKDFLKQMSLLSGSSTDQSKLGPGSHQYAQSTSPISCRNSSFKGNRHPVPTNSPIHFKHSDIIRNKTTQMRPAHASNDFSRFIFSSEIQEPTPRFSNTTDLSHIKKPYRNTYSKPSKYRNNSTLLDAPLNHSDLHRALNAPLDFGRDNDSLGSYNKYRTPSTDLSSFCVLLGHKIRFKMKKNLKYAFKKLLEKNKSKIYSKHSRSRIQKKATRSSYQKKSGKLDGDSQYSEQITKKQNFKFQKYPKSDLYANKSLYQRKHNRTSQSTTNKNRKMNKRQKVENATSIGNHSSLYGNTRTSQPLSQVLQKVRKLMRRLEKSSKVKVVFCLKMLKINSLRMNLISARKLKNKKKTKN